MEAIGDIGMSIITPVIFGFGFGLGLIGAVHFVTKIWRPIQVSMSPININLNHHE